MLYVGYYIHDSWSKLATWQLLLDFRVTFIYKVIIQIKSVIIDNIHYINFITFNWGVLMV